MRTIADAGRTVGRDVALIGFDDLPPAAYLQPPLTAVRHPRFELGVAAITVLEGLIQGDATVPTTVALAPRLMVRGSTPLRR
jgi:DNA-binding LacI/PurR family transcriptional regulator